MEKHKAINLRGELVKCSGSIVQRHQMRTPATKRSRNQEITPGKEDERRNKRAKDELSESEDEEETEIEMTLDEKIDRITRDVRRIEGNSRDVGKIKECIGNIIKTEVQKIKIALREEMEEMKEDLNRNFNDEMIRMQNGIMELKEILLRPEGEGRKYQTVGGSRNETYRGEQKPTYASTAASNLHDKDEVVIIKPHGKKSSAETVKNMKENIDIVKEGINVNRIVLGQNGSVIIGCSEQGDREKLRNVMQKKLGEEYTVKTPATRNPRVKIYGIDLEESETPEDELIGKICDQNHISKERETLHIKILKKWTYENYNNMTIILEVDTETHDALVKDNRVRVGWKVCGATTHVTVTQCYNCWGYYHTAKQCKKKTRCGRCAEAHQTRECKKEDRRCASCVDHREKLQLQERDVNHGTNDKNCPSHRYFLEMEKKRVVHSRTTN